MSNRIHPKIKQLRLLSAPFSVRAAMSVTKDGKLVDTKVSEEDRTVEGYCCVWGVRDDRGTGWIKGCFSKSIQERGPNSDSNYKIIAMWAHDQKQPLGRVIELEEDDYGLRFKILFDDVPEAMSKLRQIKSGTINQFSFGFDYVWDQMYFDEATDTVWIREAKLWEISPCSIASMIETYAIRCRNAAEYEQLKLELDEQTEELIKSLHKKQQLEIRQLIASHISLVRAEPEDVRNQLPLDSPKPDETKQDQIDMSIIIKQF